MHHSPHCKSTRHTGWSAVRLTGCAVALLMLSGCTEGVLAVHGPIAATEKTLLLEALVCMLVVVLPILLLTLVFAWWYRASNRLANYRPTWSYSGRIEFSIWIIPLLVVLFLGGLCWSGAHQLDPYKPIVSKKPPLEVDVVSLDWKWLFIYPEQKIATVNELTIPVDRPIAFKLTSATVMNSFYIPGLAGQIYTMSGMQTQLSLVASDAGTYRGMSSQFSGDGFSGMHFEVVAVNDTAFDAWVGQVRSPSNGAMSNHVFDALATAHKTQVPTYYSNVEGDVFNHALSLHDPHAGMALPSPQSNAGP
jgi:cytochrome o ubiquinol oxidase subunit II